MFRSLKNLERYVVSATDGDVRTVVNFLLDDERWVVRYLVVETWRCPLGGDAPLLARVRRAPCLVTWLNMPLLFLQPAPDSKTSRPRELRCR